MTKSLRKIYGRAEDPNPRPPEYESNGASNLASLANDK